MLFIYITLIWLFAVVGMVSILMVYDIDIYLQTVIIFLFTTYPYLVVLKYLYWWL